MMLDCASPTTNAVLNQLANYGRAHFFGQEKIASFVLFGSRARGDHELGSDIDLLFVAPVPHPKHTSVKHCSLSFYSATDLLRRARAGDLFVCHLVREGKVLADDSTFEMIRQEFRLQSSYQDDVERASDLGWFLRWHWKTFEDQSVVTRRVAWCVRTILIARAAEAGDPIFSATQLERFSRSPSVGKLIRAKSCNSVDQSLVSSLDEFLNSWASSDIKSDTHAPCDYAKRFMETSNPVGLQTLSRGRSDAWGAFAYI